MKIETSLALKRRFGVQVVIPAALILIFTIAGIVLGLRYAAHGVDDLSSQGQTYEAYRAIGHTLDDLALGQETLASCDACLKMVESPRPDRTWLETNIAWPMFELYSSQETYIFNDMDGIVFAAIDGKSVDRGKVLELMPVLQPFIERVRGATSAKSNFFERLPHSPLPEYSTVRTTEEAIHSTDLAMVRGKPALISVMRLVRHGVQANALEHPTPIIANIRYMDAGYLVEVGKQNFLMKSRISTVDNLRKGESSLPLASSRGQQLGFFIWEPLLPGSALVYSLLPWTLGAVALLTGLLAALGLCVWYLMRRDHERVQRLLAAQVELKAKEAQAHHLAYHDVLTGLPNRAHFTSMADMALVRARHGERVAIALLDLDRFKSVNDRFGHLAGDQLIEEVARRVIRIVDTEDCIARLGGDEFALLLIEDELEGSFEPVLDQILAELRRPFDVLGNQAFIGVSIGVAIAPEAGTDRSDLMRKADIALYRAKEEGRDCYRYFTDTMDDTVQLRASLEADLREALVSRQGLQVHYQPQMESTGREIVGVEALVRWQHPTRGTITPDIFVPIAEETGLIGALGDWVLLEACQVARRWPDLSVAVNLSPVQFRDEGFADHVETLIRSAGVKPEQIELEVTEGVLLDDDEVVRASLRGLRKKGFRVALDDFGTGYSSLSYLRNFEVDKIKIDKSFVKHLGETEDAAAIITAVVTLGHAMGLRVTAEGVETGDQSLFLSAAGCNELQGFLYSCAIPANDLPALFEQRRQAKHSAAA